MSGLDFVAFDVETANRNRASVCAVGLSVVKNSQLVETHSWLASPPESCSEFEPFNIGIHGITPEMVKGEPSAKSRIMDALDLVGDGLLVAHNASFDTSAIRGVFDASTDTWPTFSFACSMVLARRALNLVSYRLPLVCYELGIPVEDHHDAGHDAVMCAQVMIKLAQLRNATSIDELFSSLGVIPGQVNQSHWSGCVSNQKHAHNRQLIHEIEISDDADPANALYGQVIVFTGALSHMTRKDACIAVAERGAKSEPNVTKRTTLLVIGDGFIGDDPHEFKTTKAEKAVALRSNGQNIEVIGERDFLELLDQE